MDTMASPCSLTIVFLIVYSGADQRKHQSLRHWPFVRRIHLWPVNSPHKGPVTRKMFPFDKVSMFVRISTVDYCVKFYYKGTNVNIANAFSFSHGIAQKQTTIKKLSDSLTEYNLNIWYYLLNFIAVELNKYIRWCPIWQNEIHYMYIVFVLSANKLLNKQSNYW